MFETKIPRIPTQFGDLLTQIRIVHLNNLFFRLEVAVQFKKWATVQIDILHFMQFSNVHIICVGVYEHSCL